MLFSRSVKNKTQIYKVFPGFSNNNPYQSHLNNYLLKTFLRQENLTGSIRGDINLYQQENVLKKVK